MKNASNLNQVQTNHRCVLLLFLEIIKLSIQQQNARTNRWADRWRKKYFGMNRCITMPKQNWRNVTRFNFNFFFVHFQIFGGTKIGEFNWLKATDWIWIFWKIQMKFPKIQIKFPKIQIKFPKIQVKFPKIQVKFPEI